MSREQVLIKLNDIFQDVFDDEDIVINDEMIPEDIEEWDSIGHVYLTVSIEEEFGIEFAVPKDEVISVGKIVELILSKLG